MFGAARVRIAVWQFDLHLVPRVVAASNPGAPESNLKNTAWAKATLPTDYHAQLDAIAPRAKSWSPKVEASEARRLIIEAFKGMRQVGDPVLPFPPGGKRDMSLTFSVEAVSDCLVAHGLGLCGSPEHAQDVILHSWGSARFYSRSYACGDKPLKAHAVFIVHFRRIDGTVTELEISSRESWVSNGRQWGYGHGGYGSYAQTDAVAPTGIEENMVARYLERTVAAGLQKNARGATADP